MNDRERVLAILQGRTPDRVPWLGDLTYWAHAMEVRGQVPPNFRQDAAYYDFHRELGVGFYLQGYEPFRPVYDDTIHIEKQVEGRRHTRTVHTPLGSINEVEIYLPDSYTHALIKRFVASPADLRVLRYWFEHTHFRPDYAEATRRRPLVQDLGLVLCYLPKSPFMQLVVLLAGIQSVVNLWMEARAELEETLAAMEEKSDEAATIALASPAECLMIPENLSSEVVGKRFFERYVRGYEEKWNRRIREAGKYSFIHMDGTLRGLIREVSSAGFRVVESVTPAPVGDLAMGDLAAWTEPEPILWGGLPGLYFTDLVDDEEFDRLVREVLSVMTAEPRYVLGVADQVPPDGLRRRVARVRELVERHGAYG
jgi:hypothetical protein